MNFKKIITVFYLGFFAVTAFAAAEGGISGGGGDYRPLEDGAAWFLGDRVIQICTQTAPDFFPVGYSGDVTKEVENAFQVWASYIQSLRLNQFLPPNWPLTLQRKISSSCNGSEDLTIYFGVENDLVREARQKYVNPFAFVHRTSFDIRTGWGKGFIWLAKSESIFPTQKFPNWSAAYRLQGALTHELGHVLGCEHVSGTIMQEDFVNLILDHLNPQYQKARLTHIDGSKFLYLPLDQSYSGTLGVKGETVSAAETFRTFVGRNPIGKVNAQVHVDLARRNLSIELADEVGSSSLPVQWNGTAGPALGTGAMRGGKLFQNVHISREGYLESFFLPSVATITFGSIKTADGKVHTISFEQNMDGLYEPPIYGPISVWYYDEGVRKNLFAMSLPGA